MRIPLSIKISIGVIIAVLLQTGVLLFNAYNYLIVDEIEEAKQELHVTMSRLQQTLEFLAQKNEFSQVQAELSSLASNTHLEIALLIDDDNKIISSSKLAYIGLDFTELFDAKLNTSLISTFNESRDIFKSSLWESADRSNLYAVYPVILGLEQSDRLIQNRVGIILTHIDLSWIQSQARNTVKMETIPVLLMLGLLGIIFMLSMNRFLIRRIKNINDAARHYSLSGHSCKATISGNDELGELANSFNTMLDTVTSTNDELVKKEEHISLILNSMENGVITINEKGLVQSFNKAAEKMFGYTSDEVIGQNISIIMPEPYCSQHNSILENYIRTGESYVLGIGRDFPAQHKDGHIFSIHLSIAEFPVAIDGERLFIGSCLDITRLKEQEQQLRQSQKMEALGKLTGGIAHDYNNMLGVILGYSELLKEKLSSNPKLQKYVSEIHHAGNRGAKLTQKLLAFSRQKPSESSTLNINTLLSNYKHMLEKTLTARIQLIFDLEPLLWTVYIDENDFEDSILNICINAMHAMQQGGQLTLTTRNIHLNKIEIEQLKLKSGMYDYVCLSICDTGTGIKPDIINKIFDPFFSTKGDRGSGLGLSQVYGFTSRSNGTIKVTPNEDMGSCFNLYFPKHLDDTSSKQRDRNMPSPQSGNETILVVDDESALRDLLEDILMSQGYKVFAADGGEQALEFLAEEDIELVISDIIMPDMDGYQLAQLIRNRYPEVKIQLASGFSDKHHVSEENKELHSKILHKPFKKQELLSKVREIFDAE